MYSRIKFRKRKLNYSFFFYAFFTRVLNDDMYDAAMTGLETMTFLANGVSLVTYFYGYMNFGLTKSATTLTNFMGTAFLLSLFGGFISDTYLSRFKSCIVFASLEILVIDISFHSSFNRSTKLHFT